MEKSDPLSAVHTKTLPKTPNYGPLDRLEMRWRPHTIKEKQSAPEFSNLGGPWMYKQRRSLSGHSRVVPSRRTPWLLLLATLAVTGFAGSRLIDIGMDNILRWPPPPAQTQTYERIRPAVLAQHGEEEPVLELPDRKRSAVPMQALASAPPLDIDAQDAQAAEPPAALGVTGPAASGSGSNFTSPGASASVSAHAAPAAAAPTLTPTLEVSTVLSPITTAATLKRGNEVRGGQRIMREPRGTECNDAMSAMQLCGILSSISLPGKSVGN